MSYEQIRNTYTKLEISRVEAQRLHRKIDQERLILDIAVHDYLKRLIKGARPGDARTVDDSGRLVIFADVVGTPWLLNFQIGDGRFDLLAQGPDRTERVWRAWLVTQTGPEDLCAAIEGVSETMNARMLIGLDGFEHCWFNRTSDVEDMTWEEILSQIQRGSTAILAQVTNPAFLDYVGRHTTKGVSSRAHELAANNRLEPGLRNRDRGAIYQAFKDSSARLQRGENRKDI